MVVPNLLGIQFPYLLQAITHNSVQIHLQVARKLCFVHVIRMLKSTNDQKKRLFIRLQLSAAIVPTLLGNQLP